MIMATKAMASAKAIATIMAVKILGAAEGLRPRELMLAKALAAKTAQGPKIQDIKIMTRATLRLILLLFHHNGDIIMVNFDRTP